MIELALTALISIVLTGAAAFFTLGRKAVSRADVAEIVRLEAIGLSDAHAVCETHCPYIRDKNAIEQRLDQLQETVAEIRGDVKTLMNRRGGT